jgi:hypothetical protein
LTGTHDLAYDPVPKEVALARDYLTTCGPERAAFVVRHTLEAAKAVDFPVQTFGGTRNFLPQALARGKGVPRQTRPGERRTHAPTSSSTASATSGSDDNGGDGEVLRKRP